MDSHSRKMQRVCQICGDVAKSMHFGGLSCDSCKAFFRRSVQNDAFRHFRCGGDKQCSISIASRKFCKYCRFNKCEQVGMVKAWVMSEEERIQLMKSRLNKKMCESGDDEALKDDSLYSSYKGRVALTAGGAPNLHGLNRRRHMECRMREEGEVDPSIYASASKASASSKRRDSSREEGEVDPSTYQSSVKSSMRRKSGREPGEVDPSIYGSAVRERKTSNRKSAEEKNTDELDSDSYEFSESSGTKKKERRVSRDTDSSYSRDSEGPNDIEENSEMNNRDGESVQRTTPSFSEAKSRSPRPSSVTEIEHASNEDEVWASAAANDSIERLDNRLSDSVERNMDSRTPESNHGRNSPIEEILSRPSSNSCLENSASSENSPYPQASLLTPESNSSSKSPIADRPQFSCSYPTGITARDFYSDVPSRVLDRKDSLTIPDMPHQRQMSECGPQFPSKQHSSCRRMSSSPAFRPSEFRHRLSDYSNKENDALYPSLGFTGNSVSSSPSSDCRETKLEDVNTVLSDSNDNYALQENKEELALKSFPIEPDKYIVMINERPEVPITNYMSRNELVKLKSIVRNMQMMEQSLPYSVTSEGSVMDHYAHFIRRVTFFLNQFDEFTSWPKLDQEKAIKQNITVIALVFGSSFMKKGGAYKNTLHNPSKTVTDMTTIKGTLTPNVFDTFKEVLGILGQFEVDIRMGYMLIFNIIFDPQRHFEAHQCYGQLLYKYISWKYGATNAASINYNLFKALEGIRKHAYVFENMSATGPQMERVGDARISDVSDVCIKTENPDISTDDDSLCGNQAGNSSDKFEALRKMYYSGASISELSKFYHGAAKSQMPIAKPNEVDPSTSPQLPIISEIPPQQWDTGDSQAISGKVMSPNHNFDGGPLSRGMQEMMARYEGTGRQEQAGDSMSKGIQEMMNKHGTLKLKEMYEKGQMSDLKVMFNQNHLQQQPTSQWASMLDSSSLPHQDLSQLREMYQENVAIDTFSRGSAPDCGNFSNSHNSSSLSMDTDSGRYAGKLGKFRQMMAQQRGTEVASAGSEQIVDSSSSLMNDFKMNQLMSSNPLTEIGNDNKNNFSEPNFGDSQYELNERTELSQQGNRWKLNPQESFRRQSCDPHAFNPAKNNPALSTVATPCGVPNIHDYHSNSLVSPPAGSGEYPRHSMSSSSSNLEEITKTQRTSFLMSSTPHSIPGTLPHGACHQPRTDLFLGGSIQTRPNHPLWSNAGAHFHSGMQPPFPFTSGSKPLERPFDSTNQFQPSRLPRHEAGPQCVPTQLNSKSEDFNHSSNSFNNFSYDGKRSDHESGHYNADDFF